MVIAIIGENCSGKSVLAEQIGNTIGAEIVTGKDYLRMAKSESEAEHLFKEKLKAATVENIVYVISEKEHLNLLPSEAMRILVKADTDTIKERFKKRMNGNLPLPVEQMLMRKHGIYDCEFDGVSGDCAEICAAVKNRIK